MRKTKFENRQDMLDAAGLYDLKELTFKRFEALLRICPEVFAMLMSLENISWDDDDEGRSDRCPKCRMWHRHHRRGCELGRLCDKIREALG